MGCRLSILCILQSALKTSGSLINLSTCSLTVLLAAPNSLASAAGTLSALSTNRNRDWSDANVIVVLASERDLNALQRASQNCSGLGCRMVYLGAHSHDRQGSVRSGIAAGLTQFEGEGTVSPTVQGPPSCYCLGQIVDGPHNHWPVPTKKYSLVNLHPLFCRRKLLFVLVLV